jgi:formylglycine-generating enzyme required for sulfatase activity
MTEHLPVDMSLEFRLVELADVELIRVPAGDFVMGSPLDEWGRDDDEGPQRRVRVASFCIGRVPVTNAQYARFVAATRDPERPASLDDPRFNAPDQPVVAITWAAAERFAAWAGGRLPSELEWEYACRAGTTTSTYAGTITREHAEELEAIAWYRHNCRAPERVGQKRPNAWGLHDVLGNVWEWCADWYGPYPPVAGHWTGGERVVRGGSWLNSARYARAARRDEWPPTLPDERIGFRMVVDR